MLADVECCICHKNKTRSKSSGGGYQSFIKLRTKEEADMLKQCVTKQCGNLRLLTWVAGRDVSSIIRKKNFKEVEQYLNQKVIENFEEVTLADILEMYQQNNGKSVSSAQIQEYINE